MPNQAYRILFKYLRQQPAASNRLRYRFSSWLNTEIEL